MNDSFINASKLQTHYSYSDQEIILYKKELECLKKNLRNLIKLL